DAVLTTRELGRLIRMYGVDVDSMEPEGADTPFGERTTAGKIFGATGGVMEAAIRSAYYLVTGKELEDLNVKAARGLEGIKEAAVNINGTEVKVAVASGLGNARKLLDEVKAGKREVHFIEVMTCPGGCVGGGGQPIGTDVDRVKKRTATLYKLDSEEKVRVSHKNEWVNRLYEEFLGKPLSEVSHKLLHTHYNKREMV
ncbi:ferredoxin, partial [candidate division KSB1 bacterium]|nr:ferredoxin [candidate division KSB1 bacterium]